MHQDEWPESQQTKIMSTPPNIPPLGEGQQHDSYVINMCVATVKKGRRINVCRVHLRLVTRNVARAWQASPRGGRGWARGRSTASQIKRN